MWESLRSTRQENVRHRRRYLFHEFGGVPQPSGPFRKRWVANKIDQDKLEAALVAGAAELSQCDTADPATLVELWMAYLLEACDVAMPTKAVADNWISKKDSYWWSAARRRMHREYKRANPNPPLFIALRRDYLERNRIFKKIESRVLERALYGRFDWPVFFVNN